MNDKHYIGYSIYHRKDLAATSTTMIDLGTTVHFNTGDRITYHATSKKVHSYCDRPAVITKEGYKMWFCNGELHRENGPAFVSKNKEQYWLYGRQFPKAMFDELIAEQKLVLSEYATAVKNHNNNINDPLNNISSGSRLYIAERNFKFFMQKLNVEIIQYVYDPVHGYNKYNGK